VPVDVNDRLVLSLVRQRPHQPVKKGKMMDDLTTFTEHQMEMREAYIEKETLIDFALRKSRLYRFVNFRARHVHDHWAGDRLALSMIARVLSDEAPTPRTYLLDRRQVEKLAKALREVAPEMAYDEPNDPAWSQDLARKAMEDVEE
jgi:hypothetical protein